VSSGSPSPLLSYLLLWLQQSRDIAINLKICHLFLRGDESILSWCTRGGVLIVKANNIHNSWGHGPSWALHAYMPAAWRLDSTACSALFFFMYTCLFCFSLAEISARWGSRPGRRGTWNRTNSSIVLKQWFTYYSASYCLSVFA
jgi:hypothetical protein